MDIKQFINGNIYIDDHIRLKIIKNSLIPSIRFKYPFFVHLKQGEEEKHFLKENHLKNYP